MFGFHIECIDVWLRNNANCPICRNCISSSAIFLNPGSSTGDFTAAGSNEDDGVVIELDEDLSIIPSPTPKFARKNRRKFRRVTSVGDECIDIRQKDEQFAVQPIRRSFSMDSAADRRVYLAVQKEVQQQKRRQDEIISSGESSSSKIKKKSFFSFGYGRG
ncbi:PREDICTED: RING-H2 finger protein ATL1-like [Ipomoea nil]|uniref:RING-H2 finger protein ATL1-like n=1 Tax=Ipomoea nil TaxID=35883 RepID=UPI0009017C96|nr:PREDICTED: RING-H2 finger protein ATL1-like [Ipomoea nil]